MTPILDAYRAVLIEGVAPDPARFGAAAVVSVVLCASAWAIFHTAEFRFAENV
jgi:ABC-type polysaccharide/polyol phosphate export permease